MLNDKYQDLGAVAVAEPADYSDLGAIPVDLHAQHADLGAQPVDIPEIKAAPKDAKLSFNKVIDFFRDDTKHIASAQNIYALSKISGLPLSEVNKHYDTLRRSTQVTGINPDMDDKEYMQMLMLPLVAFGALTNPIGTAAGLIAFGAVDKVIPTEKLVKKMDEAGIDDTAVKTVELADLIGKTLLIGGVFHYSPKISEAFLKQKVVEYKLPERIELSPDQVSDIVTGGKYTTEQQKSLFKELDLTDYDVNAALDHGIAISIPSEKITRLTDKPFWADIKNRFNMPVKEKISSVERAEQPTVAPAGYLEAKPLDQNFVKSQAQEVADLAAKTGKQAALNDIANKALSTFKEVGEGEVKRVGENIIKNNPGITRRDAEAMAKDVIKNRQFKDDVKYIGTPKLASSMESKVNRKANPEYDVYSMKDHVRGVFIAKNMTKAPQILDAVKKQSDMNVEVYMETPQNNFGARGIFATTKLGDRINGEFQIGSEGWWKTKRQSDEIYHKWRPYENKIKNNELTPKERIDYMADMDKSRKLWDDWYKGLTQEERAATSSLERGRASEIWPNKPSKSDQVLPPSAETNAGLPDRIGPTSSNLPSSNLEKSNISTSTTRIPEGIENVKQKFIDALKEAKDIRGKQESIYAEARKKKFAKMMNARNRVAGEKGYYAELSALKGELPKVEFETIRNKMTQEDIDLLFGEVRNSNAIGEWEKLAASKGLAKIFGEFGGIVPTESEISLLNAVFGEKLTKVLLEKRTLFTKMKDIGLEIANIPRSLMASFDLSAPMRQGVFLIGHPKQWMPAFTKMFSAFQNEAAYKGMQAAIIKHPDYLLSRESGLSLTDLNAFMNAREEQFMGSWSEKIPLVGKGVRASGRAYTGFLNKLRFDTFTDMVDKAELQGLKPRTDRDLSKAIADFINNATGRGTLPSSFSKSAKVLNTLFFSPRLLMSRLNLLNPAYYIKQPAFVRKEALKSLFSFVGFGATVLSLSKMSGFSVGTDPRSANFGKLRIHNTRLDMWGGFQQMIRVAGQLISGQYISSTTGKVMTLGEGYKPMTRADIVQHFVEGKLAPIPSFIVELMKGKNMAGETVNAPKEIALRFVPMVIQDTYDIAKEDPKLLPAALAAIFGVGVQTYQDKQRRGF